MAGVRVEEDSLGKRDVPAAAYYGIQTLRAKENFPVSGVAASPYLMRSYGWLKEACARANIELGAVERTQGEAIAQAAHELAEGRFNDQLIVDVFQAGAGTSFHMNVNEVIANRALEILGRIRGDYAAVSPNDHVNRGQSTNDTFPSASQAAVLLALRDLTSALQTLRASLRRKAGEFEHLPKAGRTHLKDALPVTLGAEFGAYASSLDRLGETLPSIERALAEIPLGGSAVGTGINSKPGFRRRAVEEFARLTALPLRPAADPFETMQSRWPLGAASAWLRTLAGELGRMANDLRLLSSGPATGLDEIRLPEIQPGSSIMPGKVNPSAPECLNMICYHIAGADLATTLAVQAGQLEINVMMPLATFEVLFSSEMLIRYLPVFARGCVDGIMANPEAMERYLLASTALATILTPRFGYLKVAEVIHASQRTGVPVRDILVRDGLLSQEDADHLLGRQALLDLARPVP